MPAAGSAQRAALPARLALPARYKSLHSYRNSPLHASIIRPRRSGPQHTNHNRYLGATPAALAAPPGPRRPPQMDLHACGRLRGRSSGLSARLAAAPAALLLLLLAAGAAPAAAGDYSGWSTGRATFYGNGDGYSIHQGSCGFGGNTNGNLVAALSDQAPDYAGSCGRCYEVACRPSRVSDGYGNSMDRSDTCNGGGSVVVMVTDTCPCYFPSNRYSNQRWCCNDVYHFDLSYWAFRQLGDTGKGVMGVYYRQVACPGGGGGSHASASSFSSSGGSSSSSSASSSSYSSSSSSSDNSGGSSSRSSARAWSSSSSSSRGGGGGFSGWSSWLNRGR